MSSENAPGVILDGLVCGVHAWPECVESVMDPEGSGRLKLDSIMPEATPHEKALALHNLRKSYDTQKAANARYERPHLRSARKVGSPRPIVGYLPILEGRVKAVVEVSRRTNPWGYCVSCGVRITNRSRRNRHFVSVSWGTRSGKARRMHEMHTLHCRKRCLDVYERRMLRGHHSSGACIIGREEAEAVMNRIRETASLMNQK